MDDIFSCPQNRDAEPYTIPESAVSADLVQRIALAKQDPAAMDSLVAAYLPFIRQEAGKPAGAYVDAEDRVSLAMITFVNCVRQYDETRGSFLGYVSAAIHNRLLDESKKQSRHAHNTVPLEWDDAEENTVSLHHVAATREHERQQRQTELAEEIDRFSAQLAAFGINMHTLDTLPPRHARLRRQCVSAARLLAANEGLARRLVRTRRLPAGDISRLSGLSAKTLEQCRKYIIAVALLLLGDYPGMKGFLPDNKEDDPK